MRILTILLGSMLIASSAGAESPTAADALRALEQMLLQDSRHLLIEHRLVSTGAFAADLSGMVELREGQWVEWTATGTFGEEELTIGVHSDGTHISGGKYPAVYRGDTPPELRASVVIGMTRMGLLHNAAVATQGAQPEHADGGVEQWIQTTDHAVVAMTAQEGVACTGIRFNIWVDSTPSGEATLWISDSTGLPVARDQIVEFPQGIMTVRETYEVVEVTRQPTCPPCRQKLTDYGYGISVSYGPERIYVCCAGCAGKVEADWDGYHEILTMLRQTPAAIDGSSDTPVVRNDQNIGVCDACLGGLCERPEYLPAQLHD
jgi:hypothetical protein